MKDSHWYFMWGFVTASAMLALLNIYSMAFRYNVCEELSGSYCEWVLVPQYERVK